MPNSSKRQLTPQQMIRQLEKKLAEEKLIVINKIEQNKIYKLHTFNTIPPYFYLQNKYISSHHDHIAIF